MYYKASRYTIPKQFPLSMSQVTQVKDATNIVEVIGERVQLKKSGSSFKARCPFHSEKTPSFFVNEQMQRFKCFGCGEMGDVLDFLEKYEGMTFTEGLQYLAEQAGIELEEFKRTPADEEREHLLALLNLAKEYYHYLLTKHQVGQKARDYLKQRGITQQSIKVFRLGYALPSWDGLVKYLHNKKKFKLDELVNAGLAIRGRGGRYYDRFRDRIIFPLANHRKQIVGFSGRLLNPEAKEAKYINSPETQLYHKSKLLYGYSELYQEIKRKGEVIVTEGEFDVISSSQAHVNHVVAIKGSALTIDQVKLLNRVVDKVILALDADAAGVKATKRAVKVIAESDLELRILDLAAVQTGDKPKDADDMARQDPKLWRQFTTQSISVYDFLIHSALKQHDPSTPEGKRQIVTELAPELITISHAVEQDFYYQKLAELLNVKPELIKQDIEKFGVKKQGRRTISEVDQSQTGKKVLPKNNRQIKLEKFLLFLLLRSQSEDVKPRAKQLSELELSSPSTRNIVKQLLSFKPEFSLDKFSTFLADDLKQLVFDSYEEPEYTKMLKKLKINREWGSALNKLIRLDSKAKITQLNLRIEKLESKNKLTDQDKKELNKLLAQIVRLQKRTLPVTKD